MIFYMCCFFFFFKQKTAYEMRISDWSSDVCSSDLQLHFWDLRRRRHVQAIDLGAEQQFVLELRPAHDPTKAYGFAGVVLSLKDLSSSIWLWHRENGAWAAQKVIEIPAEPAEADQLPPLLQGLDRKSTRLNSSH